MRRQHPTTGNQVPGPHTPVGHLSPTGPPSPSAAVPPVAPAGPIEPPKRRRRGLILGALSAVAAVATAAEMTVGGVSFLTSLGDSSDDEPEFEEASSQVTPQTLNGLDAAVEAVEGTLGEAPAIWEVSVTPDHILVIVQVPGEPELLDQYRWDGSQLGRPEPRDHNLPNPDQLGTLLFGAEDIDTDALATALEDVRDRHPDRADHPGAELVPTSLRVDRTVLDATAGGPPELAISLHTGDNVVDSERRWIVSYDVGGAYVSTFEAGLDDTGTED